MAKPVKATKQAAKQPKQQKVKQVAAPPAVKVKKQLPPAGFAQPKQKPSTVAQHQLLPTKIKRAPRKGGSYYGQQQHDLFASYAPLLALAAGLAVCFWLFLRRFVRSKGRLPPGPIGKPLIGVANQLSANTGTSSHQAVAPYKILNEWGKKYGNIYSFYNGPSQLVVVLNDYEAIKAAFVDQADVFVGRPVSFIQRELSNGGYGVDVAEGDFWRDQRRFLLRTFQSLATPGSSYERLCMDEAMALGVALGQHGSTAFDPRPEIELSVINVLFGMCYGRRLDRQAPLLRKIVSNTLNLSELTAGCSLLDVFPLLRHTKPYSVRYMRLLDAAALQRQLLAPEIARLRGAYESPDGEMLPQQPPSSEPSCLVEYFLAQRVKLKNPDASRLFCLDNILTNIQVMFANGFEPITTSLLWSLTYLLREPNVQQKLYAELDHAGGGKSATSDRGSALSWADRNTLPYADAFLNEVLRRASVVPLGVPRRSLRDTTIGKYFIPKDTVVIGNIRAVQNDIGAVDQAQTFKPERFLNSGGGGVDLVKKAPAQPPNGLMAFGVGKRSCAGELVARMQLFVLAMNVVKQLEVRQPVGREFPSDSKSLQHIGDILRPPPFEVVMKPRDDLQEPADLGVNDDEDDLYNNNDPGFVSVANVRGAQYTPPEV